MTRPFAEVIGDPIAQSKSPIIHRYWLDRIGMDAAYQARHIRPDDLPAYVAERRADPDWRGCNVTMPHKQAIMDLVDDPGDVRASIGAMNTIVRQADGHVIGTNTDAAGFYAPLAECDLAGAPIIVVGAGGAARAVLFALARANVGPVTILNRSPLKAMGLLASFGLKGDAMLLDSRLPPAALLVNASSLGMKGQPDLDLDLSPLMDDAIVYDLVYSPLQTGLLQAAEDRGLVTIDGLDMLIGQAALAFELFFGVAPPDDDDNILRSRLLT